MARKYPQACKALMVFMQEASQFNPWLEAAAGFLSPALVAMMQIRCGPRTQSAHPSATLPSAR